MPISTTRTVVSKRLASVTPLLLVLFVCVVQPVRAPAQTTAFTYQGQLTEAGTGANSDYDLQFALFNNAVGGTQIGTTQTVPAVVVTNGLFTVQLDFGVNAFPGANRFLEIGVKPAGVGSFTTLAPRQQISSTPYAIRTLSAATADALSSACVGCVQSAQIQSVAGSKVSGAIPLAGVPAGSTNYIQNTTTPQAGSNFNIGGNGVIGGNLTVAGTLNANIPGNFIQNTTTQQANTNFNISGNGTVGGRLVANNAGIGTASPLSKLHVVSGSSDPPPRLQSSGTTSFDAGWDFYHGTLGMGYVGVPDSDASFGAGELLLYGGPGTKTSLWADGNRSVTLGNDGNVGIGTSPSQARLDVASNPGTIGVHGSSDTNRAVEGLSGSGIGVIGDSTTRGVVGTLGGVICPATSGVAGCGGTTGDGVVGNSTTRGVVGTLGGVLCPATTSAGVAGCGGTTSDGVVGRTSLGEGHNAAGVRAINDAYGDIFVGESFFGRVVRIDHEGKGFFHDGTQTGGEDYADSMRTTDDPAELEPGDVLAIDPQHGGAVRQSREPNSRLVAGVYSTQPSILGVGKHGIDDSLAGEVPVALLGVVPTKVSAENGPIQSGDLLVTSSLPGRAMKAQPEVVNGVVVYPTGAILGKALAPLQQGTGVIKVLVTLR